MGRSLIILSVFFIAPPLAHPCLTFTGTHQICLDSGRFPNLLSPKALYFVTITQAQHGGTHMSAKGEALKSKYAKNRKGNYILVKSVGFTITLACKHPISGPEYIF